MSTFAFSVSKHFARNDLVGLYSSVGWSAYANDPDALVRAVEQSSYVVTARDSGGELVGLARGSVSRSVSRVFNMGGGDMPTLLQYQRSTGMAGGTYPCRAGCLWGSGYDGG